MLRNSTTRPTYRLHWDWMAVREGFGNLVYQYCNNVILQVDKQRNVYTQGEYSDGVQTIATFTRVANEGDVKGRIQEFILPIHTAAVNSLNDAPRPTAMLQRREQGVQANHLVGIPDFVRAAEYGNPQQCIPAILNLWQVMPPIIDAVINVKSIISLPLIL